MDVDLTYHLEVSSVLQTSEGDIKVIVAKPVSGQRSRSVPTDANFAGSIERPAFYPILPRVTPVARQLPASRV